MYRWGQCGEHQDLQPPMFDISYVRDLSNRSLGRPYTCSFGAHIRLGLSVVVLLSHQAVPLLASARQQSLYQEETNHCLTPTTMMTINTLMKADPVVCYAHPGCLFRKDCKFHGPNCRRTRLLGEVRSRPWCPYFLTPSVRQAVEQWRHDRPL